MVKQLKCFCKSPPFRVFEKRASSDPSEGLGGVSKSVIGNLREGSAYIPDASGKIDKTKS